MAQAIDRDHFYGNFPSSKLHGRLLNPSRKEGFEAIFDAWEGLKNFDDRDGLAYALATAWHETGARMLPVREGNAASDEQAIRIVTAYCKQKGRSNYAAPARNGKSYFGRGYVQLTFAANYKKMGARLGMGSQLYDDPDRAMEPAIAAKILLIGMAEGLFRPGQGTLATYFSGAVTTWVGARDLINGDGDLVPAWAEPQSIGEIVAGYGKAFAGALRPA